MLVGPLNWLSWLLCGFFSASCCWRKCRQPVKPVIFWRPAGSRTRRPYKSPIDAVTASWVGRTTGKHSTNIFCSLHLLTFFKNSAMDLDDVLHQIGDWDRYQHLLLWLVCLPACIPCGFNAFNQVFMDRTPDHWCRVPQLDHFNLTLQQRKSLSIPQQVSWFKAVFCKIASDLNKRF